LNLAKANNFIINDLDNIFSKNGSYVVALNNQIGQVEFSFVSEMSNINFLSFNIVNNADISILLNEINPLVSKSILIKSSIYL